MVGVLIAQLHQPWPWDLATAVGTSLFVTTAIVFLFFLGQVQGWYTNIWLFDSIVKSQEAEMERRVSFGGWWGLWGGTLLAVSLLFVVDSGVALILSFVLASAGLVGLVTLLRDSSRHPATTRADRPPHA